MAEPLSALQRVQRVFLEQMQFPEDHITPETTFEDLGMDSLDIMDMLLALGEEFETTLPEESIRTAKTVADLVALVETK